ncbi:transcriptional regulator [Qipengyuania flava]|uniref:MucR family transcriptional regulator n=1 Tax=Qipengyuania flava TaxID=192812 RepID=UPI000B8BF76C|nr:MucR family transcriptional regulator [Qipengyuania flava]ASP31041.1 transcriptional regulator [Qipengyuania flava]
MTQSQKIDPETLVVLTSEIVSSHVANNTVSIADISQLVENVFKALSEAGGTAAKEDERPEPAISIRSSVKKDHLVCLEDGRKLKTLKRHLMTDHGMTPDEYRSRWNLPADYPMVAPDYAERRRALAKQIGLGKKPGQNRAPETS